MTIKEWALTAFALLVAGSVWELGRVLIDLAIVIVMSWFRK